MERADQEASRVIYLEWLQLEAAFTVAGVLKQCSNPPPNARAMDVSQVPGHESGEINSSTITHSRNLFLWRLAPFGGGVLLLPQWWMFLGSGVAIGAFKWMWF